MLIIIAHILPLAGSSALGETEEGVGQQAGENKGPGQSSPAEGSYRNQGEERGAVGHYSFLRRQGECDREGYEGEERERHVDGDDEREDRAEVDERECGLFINP